MNAHPAIEPLIAAAISLGATLTSEPARILPLSECTWGTPRLPDGEVDPDGGIVHQLTFAAPVDLGTWERAAGIPAHPGTGAHADGMRVAVIDVYEHRRLLDQHGQYGTGIVVCDVTAPMKATGFSGSREYVGVHYTRRADGRIDFAVYG